MENATMKTSEFDPESVRLVFGQLMEHIRYQDQLIQNWTKYYLSVQAGLAVALGFLLNLNLSEATLVNAGFIFIPFLGIATAYTLTNIINREQMWQGRYIFQVRQLPGLPDSYLQTWVPSEPDSQKRGYVAQQFWYLRNGLIIGWFIWAIVSFFGAI